MNSLAVVTTDKKLAAKLFKWLKEQPKVDDDSTVLFANCSERDVAINLLAKQVNVEGDDRDNFYIDDSDFMDNLAEEVQEAAFDRREKELEDESDI